MESCFSGIKCMVKRSVPFCSDMFRCRSPNSLIVYVLVVIVVSL